MIVSMRQVSGQRCPGAAGPPVWLRALQLAAGAVILASQTCAADAAQIAAGRYICTLSFMTVIGRIEIEGAHYRAVLKDGSEGDIYPLSVSEAGVMTLDGPVSLLSRNGLALSTARMVLPRHSELGFTLMVHTKAGVFHTVFCTTG